MVNPAASSVVETRHFLALALALLFVPAVCLGSTITVMSAADSGPNTLRAALASAAAGDTIAFNLPVPANPPPFPLPVYPTIAILSPLTMATNNVTIDGTTQPAFSGLPGAGKLRREINGAGAGAGNSGIVMSATGCAIQGLIINRCPNHGIDISGATNGVFGCLIGTNAFGNGGLNNGGDGIHITSDHNTIGGFLASSRNVCSGNALAGIELTTAGAHDNTVEGNYCGVNAPGTAAVGNFDGILVDSAGTGNIIGVAVAGGGNLCSGNAHDGIHLVSSNNTIVQGNFVGVNAAGTAIITNAGIFGIEVSGCTGTTVGGTIAGSRNVVGGNAAGIELDAASSNNTVQGNFSGVGADGVAKVGNRLHGIVLRDAGVQNNLIGGTAAGTGNTVGNNGTGGIAVFGDPATNPQNTGNAILGNSVFLNGRNNPTFLLGIDLVSTNPNGGGPPVFPTDDGHTANSNPIATAGPNNLQNAPVLTSAVLSSEGGTTITGTLFAKASTDFRIEFFGNQVASQTGFGEGQKFLGFQTVTTGADGNATISTTVSGNVPTGHFVTATATELAAGVPTNTSEFSNALEGTGSKSFADSDGDGFPDEVEVALGTDPNNAASTPFGGSSFTPVAISAPKLAIKLDFSKPNDDSLSLSGSLTVATGTTAAGKTLTVDIGGIVTTFTLDSKGSGSSNGLSVKLAIKGTTAKFALKGSKGSFASFLTDEGLTNADASKKALTVPVLVLFNGGFYDSIVAQTYSAKAGKSGASK